MLHAHPNNIFQLVYHLKLLLFFFFHFLQALFTFLCCVMHLMFHESTHSKLDCSLHKSRAHFNSNTDIYSSKETIKWYNPNPRYALLAINICLMIDIDNAQKFRACTEVQSCQFYLQITHAIGNVTKKNKQMVGPFFEKVRNPKLKEMAKWL